MFRSRITLFHIAGLAVRIDASWIFLVVLVTWSLAVGFFPMRYHGLAPQTYWLMGAVGAMGLFASILFHELSHSTVARRRGVPMKGITLFIFGGGAEKNDARRDDANAFRDDVADAAHAERIDERHAGDVRLPDDEEGR